MLILVFLPLFFFLSTLISAAIHDNMCGELMMLCSQEAWCAISIFLTYIQNILCISVLHNIELYFLDQIINKEYPSDIYFMTVHPEEAWLVNIFSISASMISLFVLFYFHTENGTRTHTVVSISQLWVITILNFDDTCRIITHHRGGSVHIWDSHTKACSCSHSA